jgi:hypothetical protein
VTLSGPAIHTLAPPSHLAAKVAAPCHRPEVKARRSRQSAPPSSARLGSFGQLKGAGSGRLCGDPALVGRGRTQHHHLGWSLFQKPANVVIAHPRRPFLSLSS